MGRLLTIFALIFCAALYGQQEKVYRSTDVDAKPFLKDGMYTLSMFVSKNFRFPELRNKKIRIFTSFIVEPDGTMNDEKAFYIDVREYLPTDIVEIQTEEQKEAESKAYEQMKLEAVRVLSLFDEKWLPAVNDGEPVRCLVNYPITFNIE